MSNKYKFTPSMQLSSRLVNKLALKPTGFLNLVNSGLSSGLVAAKTGVSTRTVQRLRNQMVEKLATESNYNNWTF